MAAQFQGELAHSSYEKLGTGECRLALSGEIDLSVMPDLVAELEYLIEQVSARLLVDLSEVTFIDSSGLVALIRAKSSADQRGGELVLTGADEAVESLLRLTHLDRYFEIRPQA